MTPGEKIALRRSFVKNCRPETQQIHGRIIDMRDTQGRLDPDVLGQSTVGFNTIAQAEAAYACGRSGYGDGSEYGALNTPPVAALAKKLTALHGGAGAMIVGSGLHAITAVFDTFLPGGRETATVLIPDNRYYPAERGLAQLAKKRADLAWFKYPGRASGADVAALIDRVEREEGRKVDMIYLEAPGSQTFEIPDIDGIVAVARQRGIRTAMDNSWASHALFNPLDHGIDLAVQALTKYESGRGDMVAGAVIARRWEDAAALEENLRNLGTGAIGEEIAPRLLARLDSLPERLGRHADLAARMINWFDRQDAIEAILSPAHPHSPDHARFRQYFRGGNGVFTVVFKDHVTKAQTDDFLDRLMLPIPGQSWGSHVTLVDYANPGRSLEAPLAAQMLRFSAGLEDPLDIERDLAQAGSAAFPAGAQLRPSVLQLV